MDRQDSADAGPDNVARPQSGFKVHKPAIIGGLYLLNIATGFTVFVGLVLAYIWRGDEDAEEWEASHFTYLIRTFWISVLFVIGTIILWIAGTLALIAAEEHTQIVGQHTEMPEAVVITLIATFAGLLLMAVWFCARCVVSMVKAADRKPMPNPKSWLF